MESKSTVQHDLFRMEGTLDSKSEQLFKEIPSKVRHSLVTFDFSGAGRINSMGIALLLRCFKEIKETKKAEIRLEGLTQMHHMLFKMTGLFLLATPVEPGRKEPQANGIR